MHQGKNIVWGVFLITLGTLMLLERFGGLNLPTGSLWPLILFVFAATSAVERNVGATVMFAMLGVIFSLVAFHLFGMTYHNSWPLLMVAAGLGMVARSLIGGPPRARTREELSHE